MPKPQPACQAYDPELWFPIGTGPTAHLQTVAAKAICGVCPLIEACRDWATETNAEFGIWGGLSEDDRRMERRRGASARRIDNGQTHPLVRALASQA